MDIREAFEKVYAQNFEKNGPTWEEDYEFALWSWDEALKWQASRQALEGEASNYRPTLGQRKAAQVGKTIGVLVQRDDGKVCAVTDLGRATWLNQDVTGEGEQASVPEAEYIRALQDAIDIIQADANTEQNYESLCRMGWVLARLKSVREQDNG